MTTPQHLDYVLFLSEHALPSASTMETLFDVRASPEEAFTYDGELFRELSDHFPVVGTFTF